MNARRHVLVVDDERRVRDMLERYLEGEGFAVTAADGAAAMRTALAEGGIDIVLLDLVLPDADGLELAREIRSNSPIPIIMLTGRGEMVDRVVGLEIGADDYIAKPFHLREVLARMRTVLRRADATVARPGASEPSTIGEILHFAGWRLDRAGRTLTDSDGGAVALTRGEFDLLQAFVEAPQRALTREVLMDTVKGRDYEAYDRAIDAQVSRLRHKIEADPGNPALIKSVRGIGYYFAGCVERA